jgi:hypothetical protein
MVVRIEGVYEEWITVYISVDLRIKGLGEGKNERDTRLSLA